MKRLIPCFVLLFIPFMPMPGSAQDADAVTAAISAELGALMNPGAATLQGASIVLTEPVQEFYTRRGFRAAWSDAGTVQQLLRALTESSEDGLDPADYHLLLLQRLTPEVSSTSAPALRAQYDILLTEALLRLSYHLVFGKVDPESFDSQWNYGRKLPADRNVPQEVEQALALGNVYDRIQALRPTHQLYVGLRRELARYRAIEQSGGWSRLPEGTSIKPGMSDARVPALRNRLVVTGDLATADAANPELYDAPLHEAVKRYQQRMGLDADGAIGAGTIRELNVPVAERITQLRVNLDRGRVLLQDLPNEFVVVNIAGYTVYFVRGEQIVWNARVQVGKSYRRTPIFRSEINYLVFNPTWTVPPGILANDILPAARKDPASITRRGLKVLDASGREIDPASVDWSRFRSGHIPYTLRQDPGPSNALGRVKLMFPNPYLVYLHDTPSQGLFDRAERTFSSGCVRVERALELAEIVLNEPDTWNKASIDATIAGSRLQNVNLKKKVPVLLAYWTAWVDPQGRVNFRRDIYGQDERWAKALSAAFKVRKQPLFESAPVE